METAKMLSQVEKDMSCKQTNLSWGAEGYSAELKGGPSLHCLLPVEKKLDDLSNSGDSFAELQVSG